MDRTGWDDVQLQNDTNVSNASPGDDIWDDMFGVKWHNYLVS